MLNPILNLEDFASHAPYGATFSYLIIEFSASLNIVQIIIYSVRKKLQFTAISMYLLFSHLRKSILSFSYRQSYDR
jgi:hypothetical protein